MDTTKPFAHRVVSNGEMRQVKLPTSARLADIRVLTKGPYLPQHIMRVESILGRSKTKTLEGLCPQEGRVSRVTSALKMGVSQTWKSQGLCGWQMRICS